MKLNAEIVYSELSKYYAADLYKAGTDDLNLSGPEFYMDDEQDFPEGRLFLATVDHLPVRPRIQSGVTLVCIGDGMNLNYYRDRADLILIRSRADFFKVFRTLQEIFDKYERWERALYRDLLRDTDIAGMAADSEEIFGVPIYVIDKSFRFVAASKGAGDSSWMQEGSETLNPESFAKFLSAGSMMTEKRNAFTLNILDKPVLCVNLFSRAGEYAGCLCLDLKNAEPEPGTGKLAEFLASLIEMAFERNPRLQGDLQASMKGLAQTLIEELPLSRAQRVMLRSVNNMQRFAAVSLRSTDRHQKMPLSYICGVFEETFRDGYAFVYGDGAAGILGMPGTEGGLRIKEELEVFCRQMRMCAGVSDGFSDLFNIKIHFRQAQSALENGRLLDPDEPVYMFPDYALTEMVINSLNGLPAETYFPEGLRAVIEHDERSQVSYLETLRVFLDENLSYSSAAQRLYIHRSTLIDRIERIEREMGIDLKDPDQRLQIGMLLKAMDLEEAMRSIPARDNEE